MHVDMRTPPSTPDKALVLPSHKPSPPKTRLVFPYLLRAHVGRTKLPLRRLGGRTERKSVSCLKVPAKPFIDDNFATIKSMGHHMFCWGG